MINKNSIRLAFFFLFLLYSAITEGQVTPKKYKLLAYGLEDDSRRNASKIIQRKWGIEFYWVSGCIVTEELRDSVKQVNDKIYKLIEAEYGKSWEGQFYKEIEAEYEIEAKIDSLVKKERFISDKEIVNPNPGAPFPMYPIDDIGNYIVNVSTYNRKWEEQKLYKLKVNYKKGIVTILKDFTRK